jgi:hypothetical protein
VVLGSINGLKPQASFCKRLFSFQFLVQPENTGGTDIIA